MDLEWTSDQLNIFFIKSRFSCNQNIGETLTQCKKMGPPMFWLQENLIFMNEMFNWSEVRLRTGWVLCNPNITKLLVRNISLLISKPWSTFQVRDMNQTLYWFNERKIGILFAIFSHCQKKATIHYSNCWTKILSDIHE